MPSIDPTDATEPGPIPVDPFATFDEGGPQPFSADDPVNMPRRKPRRRASGGVLIGVLLTLAGLIGLAFWTNSQTGSWYRVDQALFGDSTSTTDQFDSVETSEDYLNYYEVQLQEDENGIWSYDDGRGYGGFTAINSLDTGWPNDINWVEFEEGQEVLSCWAPTRVEAIDFAQAGVEFGDGFGLNEPRGFGEEPPHVENPQRHCELVLMF